MDEKKIGVIFSYASLLASSIFSIILTPYMLRTMGDVEYGLYQTISSFIGVLVVLDFGSGVATTKYISEFNLKNDNEGRNNYVFMSIVINAMISLTIVLVGIGFVLSIERIYGDSFLPAQIVEAKQLAVLYIVNIVISIYGNLFQGVIIGCKKYAFANEFQLVKIIVRYALMYVFLRTGFGAVAISIADIIAGLFFLLGSIFYSFLKLDAIPKFKQWDRSLFWASLTFSVALFIQSMVNQINNSIDKVLLGSILGGSAVAVYAVAMNIYLIYGSLAGAIRRVLLPDAVELISNGVCGEKITEFVVKGGRYQFMFLVYILGGFILVGKEFIQIWVGPNYNLAYYIAIILMIPSLFQLSTNVTETILDAMGKRMIRSIILLIGACTNIIVTILLINTMGVIGAPIGTAITCVFGSLVVLNVYHYKVMNLNVIGMFKCICNRIGFCVILAMLPAYMISLLHLNKWLSFMTKGIVFTVIYIISMYKWGLKQSEKIKLLCFMKKNKENNKRW